MLTNPGEYTGTLGFPGGHLEYGEQYKVCAERETLEETGLKVEAAERVFAETNNIFKMENKHYIAMFIHCKMINPSAVPQVTKSDTFIYCHCKEIKLRANKR